MTLLGQFDLPSITEHTVQVLVRSQNGTTNLPFLALHRRGL